MLDGFGVKLSPFGKSGFGGNTAVPPAVVRKVVEPSALVVRVSNGTQGCCSPAAWPPFSQKPLSMTGCARADPPHRPMTGTAITAANLMDLRNISVSPFQILCWSPGCPGPWAWSDLAIVVARVFQVEDTRSGTAELLPRFVRGSRHDPSHPVGSIVGADVIGERPPQTRLAVAVKDHIDLALSGQCRMAHAIHAESQIGTVLRRPGQEMPALGRVQLARIGCHPAGRVMLGVAGDRIHEHVTPDLVAQLMHDLRDVAGDRQVLLVPQAHEVHHHDLVLDEALVEGHSETVLIDHHHVRE